jgi:hypothetical protein
MAAGTRIVVTANGKDTILADWTDVVIGAPDVRTETDVQLAKFFRGKKAVVFDRGNEVDTIRVTVQRTWPKLLDARIWRLDARRLTPRFGNVAFYFADYGAATAVRFLKNAVVQVSVQANKGVTTLADYTFIGGEITTS